MFIVRPCRPPTAGCVVSLSPRRSGNLFSISSASGFPTALNSNRECNVDSASARLIPQELSLFQPPRDKLQLRPTRPQNPLAILILTSNQDQPGGPTERGCLEK